MPQNYTPEFKKKIVLLRLEEGRTINSITTEYGISKESVRRWRNEFQKECQAQSLQTHPICCGRAWALPRCDNWASFFLFAII